MRMGSPYPANTSRNNIASALTAFQILTGAEKKQASLNESLEKLRTEEKVNKQILKDKQVSCYSQGPLPDG